MDCEGPDHREGHQQADHLPNAARDSEAACAWPPPWCTGAAPRNASRPWSAGDAIVVTRARPFQQGRDRARALGQAELPAGGRDRRQHRHRRGCAGAGEAGADGVKVGIGPARFAPPASSPAWACRRSWRSTAKYIGHTACPDCRRRHPLFGRHRQGPWPPAPCIMMGGMFAGTEEAPGEVILYQGRSVQELPRHGPIGAMQQGSAIATSRKADHGQPQRRQVVPEGIEGRKNALGVLKWSDPPSSRWLACALPWLLRLRHHRRDERQRPSSSRSPLPGIRESHVHDANHQGSAQLPRRLKPPITIAREPQRFRLGN